MDDDKMPVPISFNAPGWVIRRLVPEESRGFFQKSSIPATLEVCNKEDGFLPRLELMTDEGRRYRLDRETTPMLFLFLVACAYSMTILEISSAFVDVIANRQVQEDRIECEQCREDIVLSLAHGSDEKDPQYPEAIRAIGRMVGHMGTNGSGCPDCHQFFLEEMEKSRKADCARCRDLIKERKAFMKAPIETQPSEEQKADWEEMMAHLRVCPECRAIYMKRTAPS